MEIAIGIRKNINFEHAIAIVSSFHFDKNLEIRYKRDLGMVAYLSILLLFSPHNTRLDPYNTDMHNIYVSYNIHTGIIHVVVVSFWFMYYYFIVVSLK